MNRLLAAITLLLAGLHQASAETVIHADKAVIRIVETGEKLSVSDSQVADWVRQSADAVTLYFGRFPISKVDIMIVGAEGEGVRGGHTDPGDPVTISVFTGTAATPDDLMHRDWVMVHEMIHTGLPWLPRENSWFHEGVAVYVESIARVQAGRLTQETIFRDFLRQMPRGQADTGGFATSRGWAKTYWGGALFCLVADVEIHRRTGNRKGLQDALRAINKAGNYGSDGTLTDILTIGDKATGTSVLTDLYAQSAAAPIAVDLDALWRSLGVRAGPDGVIKLDESAPEAPIRKAIFAARSAG
jgi:hypothetical protein